MRRMARPTCPIEVTAEYRLGPRARRFDFSGMELIRSTLPGCYMPLWFRDPALAAGEPRTGRSDKRTFTARWLDAGEGTMTVDFVLHGSGPASTWAAGATVGDVIWAEATKAGYEPPAPRSHLVLIGDDTAIPAIGAIVEASDPTIRITAIVEVVDADDERPVSDRRSIDPIWLHRGEDPAQTGALTLNLLDSLEVPDDAYWWVAGERDAIIAMRDRIRDERGVPRERFSLNAHWRLTATDPRRR